MTNDVTFANFITKDMKVEKDEGRTFSGHISAEVVDLQNEFIAQEEILKIIEDFMQTNPVMSEIHSNRIVGTVQKYEKSEIEGHPSVKVYGKIYERKGVTLYDKVWEKIKKGEYSGLSMGGASKARQPMVKDGQLIFALKDLELYEIAICPKPANPLAIIDYVNQFAKAANLAEEMIKNIDGRNIIQCSTIRCSLEKAYNSDRDVDVDNRKREEESPAHKNPDMLKEDKEFEDFVKEYVVMNKPIKGHSWSYWDDKLKGTYDEETRGKIIGSWEAKKGDYGVTNEVKIPINVASTGDTGEAEEQGKSYENNPQKESIPVVRKQEVSYGDTQFQKPNSKLVESVQESERNNGATKEAIPVMRKNSIAILTKLLQTN